MCSVSAPPVTSAGSVKRYVVCVLPSAKRPWPSSIAPSSCEPSASNSHGASASVSGVNSIVSPMTVTVPLSRTVPRLEVTVKRSG
jgi:hypothetical protein